MRTTVEQRLTEIAERAAFVRTFAELAAGSDETPDAETLNGVGDTCSDIERLARALRVVLPPNALNLPVKL